MITSPTLENINIQAFKNENIYTMKMITSYTLENSIQFGSTDFLFDFLNWINTSYNRHIANTGKFFIRPLIH